MASQRSHTGTTTDVYHLTVCIFDEEFSVGPTDIHFISWFQVEDVAGCNTRGNVLFGRRSGNSYVKHYNVSFRRMIGHGISSKDLLIVGSIVSPQVELVPVLVVFLFYIELFEVQMIGWDVDLNVSTCIKIHL